MNYSSPSDIAKDFLSSAEHKLTLTFARKVVYSILGGAFIALGGLLAVMIAGGMPEVQAANPGVVKFVFGAVFPVGIIMVVIAGAQLFTSDCAVLPFGAFARKVTLSQIASTWTVVYLANFAGALLVVWLFAGEAGLITSEPWNSFIQKIAVTKTSTPFFKVFVKAIGANWLVCLAVWMSYSAKDVAGKVIALWVPVMSFVALGMEHSVANMFFIPAAMLQGADITMYDFLVSNLLPATLGNIVGGVVLVAWPYAFMFPAKQNASPFQVRNGRAKTLTDLEKRLN